jgi:hypothetical protein
MITRQKLEIYDRYHGDNDLFARIGEKKEKVLMREDWYIIENFIQDISLINKLLASEDFVKTVNSNLQRNCDDAQTVIQLQQMAGWYL